jgi:hypothetical protein
MDTEISNPQQKTPVSPKSFLEALKELDQLNTFSLEIPSLQKEVSFKQLSTEQLKSILKTVVDSPIYNSQFIVTFNKIIKDNCVSENVNTEQFTVYDKILILFKTRLESLSEEYTFNFTEEEQKQYSMPSSQTINLKEHFNKFLSKKYQFSQSVIEHNGIRVICQLPSLGTENKLEQELHKNIKIEVESTEELREIIGETFINELTKYIEILSVGDSTENLLNLSFKNRVKLVEQLPTTLINKVLKYIEGYREKIKELTTLSFSELEKDISLDASFFNA